MTDYDLHHHGDAEATPGLLDFAVNVRLPAPPSWLKAALVDALDDLGRYPDPGAARGVVAARHDRPPEQVLLTSGAAETFVLVPRALALRRAVCVHPSFTEPEAALRAAGHTVDRVLLPPPYTLRPDLVPADADLVVVGNPTNPTGVLHDPDALLSLARPGRVLVVDEAFIDTVPGERGSVASRRDVPGLLVVRSLTKTWGLAGLRAGCALGPARLIRALADAQPQWPVSTLALAALQACATPAALAEADAAAVRLGQDRRHLLRLLAPLPHVEVAAESDTSFLLLRAADGERLRRDARAAGVAVRRGDTFPGLGPNHLRVAVRPPHLSEALVRALTAAGRLWEPRRYRPADMTGLVVAHACTDDPAVDAQVAADARRCGARCVARPDAVTRVRAAVTRRAGVVLVGGGPGDPDLLTLRGYRALLEADVVVTDRLGPTRLLDELPAGVEIVDVGKTPRVPAARQEDINALLISHAQAGGRVVRLKGGDPFVFGRGAEEVQACVAAGVAVEVIPGVTSVTAAPALVGIPLTHRGVTQHFTVASGHVAPGDPRSSVDWHWLGAADGTLVLLMAVEHRGAIADALVAGGRAGDTPVAIVESASTPEQRVTITTLAKLGDEAAATPAVIVIGNVVTLARAAEYE